MIPKKTTLAIFAVLSAGLLLHGTEAAAQTPLPPRTNWVVGSDELIRIALTNNLNILISQIQPEIDQYGLNGLYGAYEPNGTLNVVHAYNASPSGVASNGVPLPALTEQINSYTPGINGATPWGLIYNLTGPLTELNQKGLPDLYTSSPGITLDQPLLKNLWTDNTRYQISLSKSTLKLDQLALRNQIMTVVNNIKAAYFTLISDRELVGVQEIAVKLAEETVQEDAQKLKAGALAPLDEQQAQSQAASARSDLLTAQSTLATQENVVKGLLGMRSSAWLSVTPIPAEKLVAVPENPDVRECWRTALEQRPDMMQAKLKAETQHLLLKFDFNQLFPEIDVVGAYGRNATDLTFAGNLQTIRQGTYPSYDYGVVMTIPLGNTSARNKYKADKAALQQLVLQIKLLELTIIPAIDNDVTKIRTDFLKVDSTRQARIYAEEALRGEQTKLENGKNTSFFVLQAQQTLTARRSDEIQALANYNIDLDQLAFDEGTILNRNHIELRVR
ncbi:MAG TPA: TolC family protein [Candidatus Cybelea sp.]|nr:TolC family protein [Candidatus Cybelea sp.]